MTMECIKTACPYCGVGCGVEKSQLGIVGDKSHPANQGSLCVKGSALAESLRMPSRLLYPKYQGTQISWQQATDLIADAYHNAMTKNGPDSTAMYVSGQLLTEDYYLANKFMKGIVGSANIDTNSRLCMSSAVVAHNRAFGEDVVPVNYQDIDDSELIVICGANTAWTHPVLFRRIQQARERNPDLKLVVIDPRKTVTAQQADLHLAIANDGDVLLFNGLLRHCIEQQSTNISFIEQYTEGSDALFEHVCSDEYSLDSLCDQLNLRPNQLSTFYQWFAKTKRTVTLFCQGVNQSEQGADKANSIINAHLATGKIGYSGAGPFSVTGQPNAMGGREVGGLANQLAVHRGFDPESIKLISEFWQTDNLATRPGLKAIELFEAVERGDIQVIWIMATNPVVSMPDNVFIQRALQKCPLVIVSDVTHDSDITQYADLLLPAAGWGEKQGMVTNSERMLTRQRKFLPSKGEAKPDWKIIAEVGKKLCERLDKPNAFDFKSESSVFREYAAMTGLNKDTPFLLDLSKYAEISDEEYESWNPVQWGSSRPFADGKFSTENRKARFVVTTAPLIKGESSLWLNTGRQRDQWHTMTRTGHIAHLAATETEPTVYMNSLCASTLSIKEGQLVSLRGANQQRIVVKAGIDEGLTEQQLFMSMHWAGNYSKENQVNATLSRISDAHSGQPAFKSQSVDVKPLEAGAYGLYLGDQFTTGDYIYRSFQSEERTGIWRFASEDWLEKNKVNHIGGTNCQRRIVLDLTDGWLAVGFDQAGDEKIIRSLLVISHKPIMASTSELARLIGSPLTFSTLLSIAAQQEPAELICSCFRVNSKQINAVLDSGECNSVAQLKSRLKCGTNCGSCLPQIEQLVQHRQTVSVMK